MNTKSTPSLVRHLCSRCRGRGVKTNGYKDERDNFIYKPCKSCNETGRVSVTDHFERIDSELTHAAILRVSPKINGGDVNWLVEEVRRLRLDLERSEVRRSN